MKDVYIIQQEDIIETANKVMAAVGSTLGPHGFATVIGDKHMPRITKDGVSVVEKLETPNVVHNNIMKVIGESAKSSSARVGDGTTTATVIACNMLLSYIEERPITYIRRRKIKEDITRIKDTIKKQSKSKSKTRIKDLRNIAIVSSNGDAEIADIAYRAAKVAEKDGMVFIEHNNAPETKFEVDSGYKFMSGLLSKYFITNKHEQCNHVLDPYIIVGTKPIEDIHDILPILNAVKGAGFLIVSSISNSVRSAIEQNFVAGHTKMAIIELPGSGVTVEDYAEDIATFADVPLVTYDGNMGYVDAYQNVSSNNVERIYSTLWHTVMQPKKKDVVEEYVNVLDAEYEAEENSKRKNEIKRRKGQLLGKIVTVKVGSSTFIGKSEIIDRLDDAVRAVQSAMKFGVASGGGTAIYNALEELENVDPQLRRSLISPMNKIMKDMGISNPDEFIDRINDENIIDPYEAVIAAVEAGTDSALNLLSAKAMLVDED